MPYQFQGEAEPERKRFVVIGHHADHAICVKATSQTEPYVNNPEKMAGCVFYKAGETDIFARDTVIQPDNQLGIPHAEIARANRQGRFTNLGQLPGDFHRRLLQAIEGSVTLDQIRRARLRRLLAS